jgi:flagellar hook-associated protein 2
MDSSKVSAALTEDYEAVAQLFSHSKLGEGVAERVSNRLKEYRDSTTGVIKTRLKGLDNVIENQDKEIVRRESQLVDREEMIKRRFTALDSQLSNLHAQGNFLAQRFAGGDGSG